MRHRPHPATRREIIRSNSRDCLLTAWAPSFRCVGEEVLEVEMVAGFDLVPGTEAAVYFEHELRGAVDAAQRVGLGLRVGDDPSYPERGVGEKHVERNLGIMHPEISRI